MNVLRESLMRFNPWWKNAFSLEYRDREIYGEIRKYMPLPQMISLTGLRRVGKTTLLYKLIEDALGEGFDPLRIVYFSLDEFKAGRVSEILDEYERIVGRDISEGEILLVLDEIQKLDEWQDQIKVIYDQWKGRLKIVVSGSESLFIRRRTRETLAGRLFEFQVDPLTFREYLRFTDTSFEPIHMYEKELSRSLRDFIRTQGFPELIGVSDNDIVRKYIEESIVEKVLFRDLQLLIGIRDITLLSSLLKIIAGDPGRMLDLSDMAGELGTTRQTVSNYLSYLEDSFMIRKLYNYSRNLRKTERKLKRYYPAIISTSLLLSSDPLSESRVFEWFLTRQLKGEFFWRDKHKNEVDLILGTDEPTPVEIKYGRISTRGLEAFMKRFDVKRGYILTPEREEKIVKGDLEINFVPAYKFLLEHHPAESV